MKTQIKYHTHTHTITWAGKMTQRVEMPVTKPKDLNPSS